jgi:hypothetical protein
VIFDDSEGAGQATFDDYQLWNDLFKSPLSQLVLGVVVFTSQWGKELEFPKTPISVVKDQIVGYEELRERAGEIVELYRW